MELDYDGNKSSVHIRLNKRCNHFLLIIFLRVCLFYDWLVVFKEVTRTASVQQKHFATKGASVYSVRFFSLKFQFKSIILIVNLIYISAVRSHQMTLKADIACFLLVFIGCLVSVVRLMMEW